MGRLAGKTALVIGASTGIGREVCRVFAREGADVAVGDYGHQAEQASLVAELGRWGRDAFPVEVNVLAEEQVAGAIAAAIRRFGHLEVQPH